jgi:hypothetical protein
LEQGSLFLQIDLPAIKKFASLFTMAKRITIHLSFKKQIYSGIILPAQVPSPGVGG